LKESDNNRGSLEQTAKEIRERGGTCFPIQVDHDDDNQIEKLFKQIEVEQDGQLDILVNNAYKAAKTLLENRHLKFWETKPEIWDDINGVGLRSHYICLVYAARLMVPRKQGLIINISSMGGKFYIFSVPYGVGKAAVDRMAVDCGIELKKHNIAVISLWLGSVATEGFVDFCNSKGDNEIFLKEMFGREVKMNTIKEMRNDAESVEFGGKCVVHLAKNKNLMKLTSKVIVAEDYAQSNGIRDIDNRIVPSFRQINAGLKLALPQPFKLLTLLIPNFVKIPIFFVELFTSKF
jgi:dehydrogenase/reductase SDR family protein 1